jgi:hypothetical protein
MPRRLAHQRLAARVLEAVRIAFASLVPGGIQPELSAALRSPVLTLVPRLRRPRRRGQPSISQPV